MRQLAQSLTIGDYQINGPDGFALGEGNLGGIVSQTFTLVFSAAGIGLLLMIIKSGFTLMTSAGDAKKAATGKATLTNSVIGFLLIFSAFWITQILGVVFGWENSIGSIFGQ